MLTRLAPAVFVLLWSTGFIASKLGAPYAEPFTFLSVRFVIVILVMAAFCAWVGAAWPRGAALRHAVIVGALIHGVYLGGVFWAIRNGLPAGVSALIVSLQPVLTAVVAAGLLGERITPKHWLGLALGLAGAVLVVGPKLDLGVLSGGSGITPSTVAAAVAALVGMTLGTIYQKNSAAHPDLRTGSVAQFAGALAVTGPLSLILETREITWAGPFVVALGWLVIVLSIVSITLLMVLIRENAVARLSGLFYLVPAVTAILAYAMFGEALTLIQVLGIGMVMAAVVLIDPVGHK